MYRNRQDEFLRRTRNLGVEVLRLVDVFPKTVSASVVARQLARSASSVGANYRSVCRARSNADMVSKLHIVEEECDETIHWLEVAVELGFLKRETVEALMREAGEILSMTVASILTLKGLRRR